MSLFAQENVEKFKLDTVVSPRIAKMAVPVIRPEMIGVKMTVSSPSAKAREHVRQGFALIHAQWDFEAYRHFCAALTEDPDCMLAYCGVALSLIKPNGEYTSYRNAAVSRMVDLIEADEESLKADKPARYPKLEKQFAYAVASLITSSPARAGAMMKEMAKTYPNVLQAKLLGAFLTRGAYDMAGNASNQRKQAIETIRAALDEYPDNPMVLGFWLSLHAESPADIVPLKKEVLPYARKLVTKCPGVPSWHHALGHFEWRAGNYLLAQRAFAKASELYRDWMTRELVSLNDCEGYVRAQCYLANTLYHRGDFDGAMKIAKDLRALKLDPKRPASEGNHILLWRAYNLPARLYVARAEKGDFNMALASLPDAKELDVFLNHRVYPTLAGSFSDSLRAYIGCRKALEKNDLAAAKSLHEKSYQGLVAKVARVLDGAKRSPDYSHYYRAAGALAVYDMELYGLRGMQEKEIMKVTTANHFRSARDKQITPSMMMPPLVITHMENRLAEYYLKIDEQNEAYGAYQDALGLYPNNMDSLRGIKKCYLAMGQNKEAEQIQKHIDLVSPKK
ncbi:MAG: hypothetical protein AB8F34_03135 [Akkermansiaceae bacterium]